MITKRRYKKKIVFLGLMLVMLLVFVFMLLKGFDSYLMWRSAPLTRDEEAPYTTMRTLDYYGYTGMHIQANYHETGQVLWTDFYDNFDVQSGDYGFFIDFDLNDPPQKGDNEFRIILTGGSAA